MHKLQVKGTRGTLRRASAAVCAALLAAPAWAAATAQSAAPKINDPARGWDSLWHEVIVDITIIGILFAVVTAWFITIPMSAAVGAIFYTLTRIFTH